jgi:hypothetical protein
MLVRVWCLPFALFSLAFSAKQGEKNQCPTNLQRNQQKTGSDSIKKVAGGVSGLVKNRVPW